MTSPVQKSPQDNSRVNIDIKVTDLPLSCHYISLFSSSADLYYRLIISINECMLSLITIINKRWRNPWKHFHCASSEACWIYSPRKSTQMHFYFFFTISVHSSAKSNENIFTSSSSSFDINIPSTYLPLVIRCRLTQYVQLNHWLVGLIISECILLILHTTCRPMVSPIDDNTSRHWSLVVISHWRRRASCWRKRKCLNTGTLNMKQKNVPIIYYPQIAINIQSV